MTQPTRSDILPHMSQQAASRTQIHPCDPSHRNLAFELLLREFPPEERASLVERLATITHPAQLSGLLGAYRANQLCGIVWAQCQPGNTAVLWPPQLFEQDASATADALLDAALDHCLAGNTRLVQSMLSTDSSSTASLLRRHGFTHLADLLYLVAHRLQFPDSPPAPDLEFESFQESQYSRFAQLIESTYLHSLDCPALDGVRPLDDVLNGYRNTGEFSPSRWLFVRQSYCDVGCLLLADHPADDQWELVYMGVRPPYGAGDWVPPSRGTRNGSRTSPVARGWYWPSTPRIDLRSTRMPKRVL